jgi:hypothetical protein
MGGPAGLQNSSTEENSMSTPTSVVWYKSNTLRALAVAAIAQVLYMTGAATDAAPAQAEELVQSGLAFIELVALAWAAYARTAMPTPPVTMS